MDNITLETRSIPVTVDKSHLVTIGEKLYTEKMSFIRELVNNSYDADATQVQVDVAPATITVRDDGSGMDESGLRQYFTIGSALKKAENLSPRFGRTRVGEFGIGKFAALAACQKFEVDTQQGDFHARLLFDKDSWSKHEDWHLNIDVLSADSERVNGTIVVLHGLNIQFALPRVRRYLAERTPIQAANFAVWLNGERISEEFLTGRQMAVLLKTAYGTASGKIIIVSPTYHQDHLGVAVAVKGILVRYESFGLEKSRQSGSTRITGRINADWLPITSNRDDFIRDAPEFLAFTEAMKKELRRVLGLLNKEADAKANAQASRVLKEALSKIGKVLKNYQDLFPQSAVALGVADKTGQSGYEISRAEFMESGQNLPPEVSKSLQAADGKRQRRQRISGILGGKSVIRNLKIGNLDIAVRLEHLGRDDESALAGGVIYVNLDHPLYRTYQNNDELLTQHVARIITKELTLQAGVRTAEEAFALQARLLTDALKTKGS